MATRDILPKVTEYGSPAYRKHGGASVFSILRGWDASGREINLVDSSKGWEVAGSMARWTDGYYCVRWHIDGAQHGRKFVKTSRGLESARALFQKRTAHDAQTHEARH